MALQTPNHLPLVRKRGGAIFLSLLFLLCFTGLSLGNTTQESVFSKKETLYSTMNGNAIGEVLLSIAPKSNNEWLLIIGNQGGTFVDSRNETTLWIFNKKTNANQFKRDLRNQDYPVEVKGIGEFMPFCENGIRFALKDWEELRKQTQVSFFINASPGEKVTLRLVFYTATTDRKKTTIDDEAKVRIEFEVPDLSTLRSQTQRNAGGGVQGGEVISLTEKIDPETRAAAAALLSASNREDSIAQAEAANRGQRVALLNSFISERNREIGLFQEDVNTLLADKKTKVEESAIDSLSTIADEMKNRVDYWENGYSDILLTEEAIHDKFSKFRIAHALTSKKIDELRQQQNPLNSVLNFIKKNMLMSIGIGIGGLIFLKLLTKLGKKLMSMMKSKINQKMNKMKTDAAKKVKEESKSMFKRKKKQKQPDDELENIDINDLAEI